MPTGVYPRKPGATHKPHSEETKRKIGLKSKGRKMSAEARLKMSAWQKGKFRTEKPTYGTKHWRVYQVKGKATSCSSNNCPCDSTTFDWANVSGQYLDDPNDYISLCRKCHYAYDAERVLWKY